MRSLKKCSNGNKYCDIAAEELNKYEGEKNKMQQSENTN